MDKDALIAKLHALLEECAEPRWDGYGAAPLQPSIVPIAEAFIQALPTDYPPPDIVPESDGVVAFEWQTTTGIISVSMDESGELPCAWIFDAGDSDHATFEFNGKSIPALLLARIQRITKP